MLLKKLLLISLLAFGLRGQVTHDVLISWQYAGTNTLGFHIWKASGSCSGARIVATILVPTVYFWEDDFVASGTTYCYFVSAFNASGESSLASPTTITVPTP